MDFDSTSRMIGFEVDSVTAAACRYLERSGRVFLVDFGSENAIEQAGGEIIERDPNSHEHVQVVMESLPVVVDGLKLTCDDRRWLREMEAAFGETPGTDLSRAY